METLIIIFLGIILLAVAVLIVLLLKKQAAKPEEKDNGAMMMLQNQIAQIQKTVDEKLNQSQQEMQSVVRAQFGESQKLIKDITTQVTQVHESSKQVFTIADQLQNLEKVLKHQKQRGNLGEASLELIISNILSPTDYELQYEFKGGITVDAVIKTKEGLLPVDAKFSLDNYNRVANETDDARRADLEKDFKNDLKKRIDETAKYILPKEGTLPFAFMFIPAEGIYYDLLVNEVGAVKVNTRNLIDYAYNDKKVIIVSPTTFAAYLQSVLFGLRAYKIEQSAQDIIRRVSQLAKHLGGYEAFMQKLGTNLGTTVNAYNTAYKELGKIDKDVVKITEGESAGIEPMQLERPTAQEIE